MADEREPPCEDTVPTAVGPGAANHAAPTEPGGRRAPGPAGRPFGPYLIERELARGGMGIVYLARHGSLDRRVALKTLPAASSPLVRERFAIEARAVARLRHPHIIRIHDVGREGDRPFFAMDLIAGGSLASRLRDGALDPRRAALLAAKLARALAWAHAAGVIHRDLKPANVLLDGEGEPILSDFGLARIDDLPGPTRSGEVMGTPAFMPPEQADGAAVDARSDVYSLGATLYAMLTGVAPFRGETSIEIYHKLLSREPVPPSRLSEGLPRDLETICLRCLEKSPGRRYGSAAALADDLEHFLADRPIAARRPGWSERVGKWVRRNRTLARVLAGAALLVLLLAGGAALWFEGLARRAAEDRYRALAARPLTGLAGERVATALDVLLAAQRWAAVAGEAEEAREAVGDAALELGGLYLEEQRYDQLAWAIDQAREARPDGPGWRRLDARLREALQAASRARVQAVGEERERARAGALLDDEALERAVDRLVRLSHPETVALLCTALDSITVGLRRVEVGALRAAQQVLAERDGRPPIAGLDTALVALEAGGYRGLSATGLARVMEGWERVEHAERVRAGAMYSFDPRSYPDIIDGLVAAAPRLAEIPLLCRTLARLGDRAAVASLGAYLDSDWQLARGLEAIRALARLDGPEASRLLFEELVRSDERKPQFATLWRCLQQLEAPPAVEGDDAPSLFLRGMFALTHGRREEAVEALVAATYASSDDGVIARAGLYAGRALRELGRFDESAALLAHLTSDAASGEAPHLELVRLHLDRGALDSAQVVSARALDRFPDSSHLYAARAEVFAARGQRKEAEGAMERAIARGPDAGIWSLYAHLLQGWGSLDEARGCLRRAVALEPGNPDLYLRLGALESEAGRYVEAHPAFDRAVHLAPWRPACYRSRAENFWNRDMLHPALIDARQWATLAPSNPAALLLVSELLLLVGDTEGGAEMAERAVALDPTRGWAWCCLAVAHRDRGDLERARELALEAVELAPENPRCVSLLGEILVKQGEHAEGIDILRLAVELAPTVPERHYALIDNLLQAEAWDGARAALDRAFQLEGTPPKWVAQFLRQSGAVALARGRPEEAAQDFAAAVSLVPEQPLFHGSLAAALEQAGAFEEALEAALTAARLDPLEQGYRLRAAVARMKLGRWDEAEADLRRALELDPDFIAAHLSLALCHQAAGDLAAAVGACDDALRIDPADADGLFLRASLRLELGSDGVREDLEAFLQVVPEDPRAAQARLVLATLGTGD